MPDISRQSVLQLLDGEWAAYVARFQALSPAARAAFLHQQGYPRLADLLAHIVAWWQVGLESIQRYRTDPAARQPEIDIDSFNARAVEQVRHLTDEQEMLIFEATRRKFVDLVAALSEHDFKDERILTQIQWELINHLEEHPIQ